MYKRLFNAGFVQESWFSAFFPPHEQINSPDINMNTISLHFIIYSLIVVFADYE